MSDRAVQSYYASAEKTRHPLHNYQSLDMSHSSGASFNNARQEQNQLSSPLGHATMNYPSLSEMDNTSDISGPLRGFRKFESRSASLTTRLRNFSNYKPSSQGYPISDLYQPSGRGFFFKNDRGTNDVQVLKSQLARNFDHSNNALCISRGEFSSVHPVTPPWTETSHSTASQIQPYILAKCIDEGGRSSVPSLVCRQENDDHLLSMQAFRKNSRDTDLRILEQGYGNYQSDSTLLLSQEKKDICSTSRKSVIPVSRKDDGSFLMLNDVSPKHNHSQGFCQEQHQGIRNLSEIGLFPSWSSSSKLEMLDQQHCSHARFRSAHDVKTMRTYPPVNPVKRASEGPHIISQTTRSLLNRERVNVSFCKEKRLFEKSGVLDLNKNSCQLSGHSQQGVKLQLLDSLTDSGEIENVQHPSSFLFVSKNESSAETGAFNTDIKENHLSGAKSFPVNKDVMMDVKLSSTDAFASPEEVQSKLGFSEIPDLNTAIPDLPDDDNLMGNLDPSAHKTKSLERGSLHAVEPTITSRRRKRRKINDILNLGDSPRQEIVNKSQRQIRKGRRPKSELTFAGKEVIVLDSDDDADDGPASVKISWSSSKELTEIDKKTASDKNDKSPSAEGVRKTEEITPHSWLRSWPLNPPTVQQTAQTVVCKPQSSYVAFEPIGQREVPSTAAMAVITSVFNKQININDKDKGSYKGQEELSMKPCTK